MENIKIRHFSGLQTDWDNKIAHGDFNNDIVFAKAWKQDASTLSWEQKLIIYAGKDNLNQEYQYVVPDFATFESIVRLVDISKGCFTSDTFRNSLENYLLESEKMLQVDSSITQIEQRMNEIVDTIVDIDTSVKAITNSINDINSSIDVINASLDDINASILYIEQSIDWNEES